VGLKIEQHVYYFARSEAIWWSVLAMRPFQLFAVLRYLPKFVQRWSITLTERLTRSVPRAGNVNENEAGYLLITARKG
jgi:hypothetical protein